MFAEFATLMVFICFSSWKTTMKLNLSKLFLLLQQEYHERLTLIVQTSKNTAVNCFSCIANLVRSCLKRSWRVLNAVTEGDLQIHNNKFVGCCFSPAADGFSILSKHFHAFFQFTQKANKLHRWINKVYHNISDVLWDLSHNSSDRTVELMTMKLFCLIVLCIGLVLSQTTEGTI